MVFNAAIPIPVQWLRFELSYRDIGSFLLVVLKDFMSLKNV